MTLTVRGFCKIDHCLVPTDWLVVYLGDCLQKCLDKVYAFLALT